MELELKAYAKVNLTLDALYRRPDGYHQLKGIMYAVSLHDTVRLRPLPGVEVESDIPLPFHNTARRAAELFRAVTGKGCGIYIEKRIPEQAGLGGGSADAAAVLAGLNRMYGFPVPEGELLGMGLQVGADVPFCLAGGCAVAEGVGEVLTPLPVPELHMAIAKGCGGVSTGELFRRLKPPLEHPDTDGAAEAIRRGDVKALYPLCRNALEPAAIGLMPEIAANKAKLLALGARAAFMTGSGAAVVGLFEGQEAAMRAAKALDTPFAAHCTGAQYSISEDI